MIDVHDGCAVAASDRCGAQCADCGAGAEIQRAGGASLRCDADARCGDRSVVRHGEAACASSTDNERAVIRPPARTHDHRAVTADSITHIAICICHIARAIDREATRAFSTDKEVATIRPCAPAHGHRAVVEITHIAIDTRHITRAVDREAACAIIADREIAIIRPRAPAHAHRAVAADLIANDASVICHIARAIDREATCATRADIKIAAICPRAPAHGHRAVASR